MITRLGAAILLGSLVTVGSACAEPALDPDRFLDFGADTSAALAAAEPAPIVETATSEVDLAALAPDNFLDPQPGATAELIAASLASAGTPPEPAAPVVAEETGSEEPAEFALILPEPPPVDLVLTLPEPPVDVASVEGLTIDLSDFDQAAFVEAAVPGVSPVDVAQALAPEHFLDTRDEETLAWIAEDLVGSDIVETGSIGDGPNLMPVTGEHGEFRLDLEPLAP
jgi:hypothetical protein